MSDEKQQDLGPATIADPLLNVAAGDRFGNLAFTRQFLAEYMGRLERQLALLPAAKDSESKKAWHAATRRLMDEYATAIVGRDDRYPIIDGWHNLVMLRKIWLRLGHYEPQYDWDALLEERGWPEEERWAWVMLEWLGACWLSALNASFGDRDAAGELFARPFDFAVHMVNGSFDAWEDAQGEDS